MANDIVVKNVQLKTGTQAAWAASNFVLLKGQPGYELDTYRHKVGDGSTKWNDLPYLTGFTQPEHSILENLAAQTLTVMPLQTPVINGPAVPTNKLHPVTKKRVWTFVVGNPPNSSGGLHAVAASIYFYPNPRIHTGDVDSFYITNDWMTLPSGFYGTLSASTPLLSSGLAPSLQTDGSGYLQVRITNNSGAGISYRDLGVQVEFTYSADNPITVVPGSYTGGNKEFLVRGPAGADGITLDPSDPRVIEHNSHVGEIIAVYGDTPPGTLECDGSLVAVADFPELANHLVYTNPSLLASDNAYIYLPDLRGQFLRGIDSTGARPIGGFQGDSMQRITGEFGTIMFSGSPAWSKFGPHMPDLNNPFLEHKYWYTTQEQYGGGIYVHNYWRDAFIPVTNTQAAVGPVAGGLITVIGFDSAKKVRTSTETRPVNMAVRYCIRYKSSILAGVPSSTPGTPGTGTGMTWPPMDHRIYGARDKDWEQSVLFREDYP